MPPFRHVRSPPRMNAICACMQALGAASWSITLATGMAAAVYTLAAWSRSGAACVCGTPAARAALSRQVRVLLLARAGVEALVRLSRCAEVMATVEGAGDLALASVALLVVHPLCVASGALFLCNAEDAAHHVYAHMLCMLSHAFVSIAMGLMVR